MRSLLLAIVLVLPALASGCVGPWRAEPYRMEFAGVEAFAQYDAPWNDSLVAEALAAQGFVIAAADDAQVVTENASRYGHVAFVRAAPGANATWDLVYEGRLNVSWVADEPGGTLDVWRHFEPDVRQMREAFESHTGLRSNRSGYALLSPG